MSSNHSPTDARRDEEPHDLNDIFAQHRDRLRRMIRLRMDRRLQGRVDASDVIQEAYIEAAERFDSYQSNPEVSPFIWLRFLTGQKLIQLQRRHLGAQARDANREVSIYRGAMPEATSAALAAQLIGKQTSPTQALARAETKLRVQGALNDMDEIDREVLALRHFEQLTNAETATILGVSHEASYKRYVRALKRLKDVLGELPG